ncbi:putative ribonuclease H-like domain-containing protein [Tanacetum coccineum]
MTHSSPKRNMVPKAVLMRSGLVSLTTVRPVNTTQPKTTLNSARPMTNIFNKAHSTVRRPINNITATKNNNFNKRVNTVSGKNVNTAKPKAVVNAARPKAILNAIKGNQCINHSEKGNPQMDLQDQGVIDSGCSRHMIGNMSYLTDFEVIDGGYVAFGGNPKRGKIKGRDDDSGLVWGFFFFLATKDEISGILKSFITGVKNLIDQRVKVIRCDNGTEFKNKEMDQFCERKGSRPNWLFDIDALTKSMNYKPVVARNQSNGNAGTKACDDGGKARMETISGKDYILLPLWPPNLPFSQNSKSSPDVGFKPSRDNEKNVTEESGKEGGDPSNKNDSVNSTNNINTASDGNITNNVNTVSSTVNTTGIEVNAASSNTSIELPNDPNMHELEDIVYSDDYEDVGSDADMNNLNTFMPVSPIPTTRIHKDHPVEQIIRDLNLAPQTTKMIKNLKEHEEGIDYDEVFAPVARIEAIRLFLAYTSFKDFVVYQMDVKSAFLYGKIEEEVYVCQPLGFEDPDFPDRVYKVEKALYRLHQAPRAWYETLSTYLLDNAFQRGKIDKTLFIRRDKGDILLVQVYVDDIIFGSTKKSLCTEFEKMMHKKFQMSYMGKLTFFLGLQKFSFTDVKTASTPMETQKPLLKDEDECACARYQVNLKVSHLHAVKRIFKYLKGQPILGLWYPKDSPFDLVAYIDSAYAGASLDRKSTIGGCQFLGCRLISWQCKKQTMVVISTTEAEYVAASSCYGQVLWIPNQFLDYGYNFMHTKIYIDKNSTIRIVKNLVFHSKTKHIKIRHHFIKDSNEKKLIQMIKIHTNKNIADLLTKPFDVKMVNGEQHLQALVDEKKIIITEATVRRDLQLEDADGVDCLPNATIFEQLTLMGTFLEGKNPYFQLWWFKLKKKYVKVQQCQLVPITQPSSQPQRRQKSRRPKEKDTQAPQSSVPSDPTNIADEAVTEEPIKKLENKGGSRTHRHKRLYKGRIDDIDADKDIYLVYVHKDEDMFGVNDLEGDEVVVESEVADKDVNLSVDEVTLAQALAALKSAKVPEKGDVIKEPSVPVSASLTKQEQEQAPTPIVFFDNKPTMVKTLGKGQLWLKEELSDKMSKKELLKLDKELAFKLQAEEDEEERLAREKAQKVEEANIAWDDIQAKVEADYQLASTGCKFSARRVVCCRKVKESSKKAEAEIAQESSSKIAEEAIEQESSKKQKVNDDKETEELKQMFMEIHYR